MATKEQKQQLSEEREELTRQRALDTIDRYKFLLGQSELFSHFIRAKGKLIDDERRCCAKQQQARSLIAYRCTLSLTYKHDHVIRTCLCV